MAKADIKVGYYTRSTFKKSFMKDLKSLVDAPHVTPKAYQVMVRHTVGGSTREYLKGYALFGCTGTITTAQLKQALHQAYAKELRQGLGEGESLTRVVLGQQLDLTDAIARVKDGTINKWAAPKAGKKKKSSSKKSASKKKKATSKKAVSKKATKKKATKKKAVSKKKVAKKAVAKKVAKKKAAKKKAVSKKAVSKKKATRKAAKKKASKKAVSKKSASKKATRKKSTSKKASSKSKMGQFQATRAKLMSAGIGERVATQASNLATYGITAASIENVKQAKLSALATEMAQALTHLVGEGLITEGDRGKVLSAIKVSSKKTSKKAAKKKAVSKKASSKKKATSKKKAASKKATRKKATSKKKAASKKATRKKATSKKKASKKKATSKKKASSKKVTRKKKATSKKAAKKKAVSKKASSKKKATSKKATSKKASSKKVAAKKGTSKKATSKKASSKAGRTAYHERMSRVLCGTAAGARGARDSRLPTFGGNPLYGRGVGARRVGGPGVVDTGLYDSLYGGRGY